MNEKIKKIQNRLKSSNLDFVMCFNMDEKSSDFFYLTGFKGHGILIIPVVGKAVLLTSAMEIERAKSLFKNSVLFEKDLQKQISTLVPKKSKVGLIKNSINVVFFDNLKKYEWEISDFSSEISSVRMIKTDDEIENIKKACEISDKIFAKCLYDFDFKSEFELKNKFLKTAIDFDVKTSFDIIVASGKNAALPHYSSYSKKINNGFCVIDFGVFYKGYTSDTTRTVFIGNPSSQERKTYDDFLELQQESILRLKSGAKFSDVDYFVRKKLGPSFCTALGHGIGIDVHEMPRVGPGSPDVVSKNMVFTIEPGVYKTGKYGIRIEDDIVFTNKPVVLTKFTREMLVFR